MHKRRLLCRFHCENWTGDFGYFHISGGNYVTVHPLLVDLEIRKLLTRNDLMNCKVDHETGRRFPLFDPEPDSDCR